MRTTTTYRIEIPKAIAEKEEGKVYFQMQILNAIEELKTKYNFKNVTYIDHVVEKDTSDKQPSEFVELVATFDVEL